MARFAMCAACAREYADPARPPLPRAAERVPRVRAARVALATATARRSRRPIRSRTSARALAGGAIAAVKGIGGYHLACDATSTAAVATLRERKRREEKPLAVMVRDLDAARALAELGDAEAALLASVERPIVLCRRRAGRARSRRRSRRTARSSGSSSPTRRSTTSSSPPRAARS